MKKMSSIKVAVIFIAVLAILFSLASCSKKNPTITSPETKLDVDGPSLLPPAPAPNGQPVTATIGTDAQGYIIPSNFVGLSYETNYIARDPAFLNVNNTVLLQLIKNLGDGMIRFGGSSSDETTWTGKTRKTNTGQDSLTTTDVDQLSAFVKATGWKAIFGLNLGNYNPVLAANEAVYVSNAFGSNLYVFQFGNEINNFGTKGYRNPFNYSVYDADWVNYRNAVKQVLPSVALAGPDASNLSQVNDFVSSFANARSADVVLLTDHYYGGPSTPTPTFETITSTARYNVILPLLAQFNTIATSKALPYRITESGSVSSGGTAGVSDTYASALWALDFMWQVAMNRGQGVDFHGSATAKYTPIARDNSVITLRPGYYAMLAFKSAGTVGGRVQPVSLTANGKLCTAYACTNGGRTYVTLLNRDIVNLSYTINLPSSANSVKLSRLSAPSISATAGITFAGSSVNTDGTFTPSPIEEYAVGGTTATINVPARTAVVLTFQ